MSRISAVALFGQLQPKTRKVPVPSRLAKRDRIDLDLDLDFPLRTRERCHDEERRSRTMIAKDRRTNSARAMTIRFHESKARLSRQLLSE